MKMCTECSDFVPVKSAIALGLVSGDDVLRARNDVRGCNGFCRCEDGLINTTRKEDDGCLAFVACGRRSRTLS